MTTIRVTIRNAEAVVRPDQAELWVQGEQISPGGEKTFDLAAGEPFNVEVRLTDDMEERAIENAEADERVPEENEKLRVERERAEADRQERLKGKKNQEGVRVGAPTSTAGTSQTQPSQAQRQGTGQTPHPIQKQGFSSSPAPKTESPPKQTESRSGIDSKEVKGQAPLKK